MSATRWPRPDFVATPRRTPVLAWVLAAVVASVLALGLVDVLDTQQRIDAQEERLAKATRRLNRAAPVASVAASGAGTGRDALLAARRVAEAIDHPWAQLLATVEEETPVSVQWLVFEHDAESPELRLEGVSADTANALQLVDALSARAGWSEVALSRLQATDPRGAGGSSGAWRFEIRAVVAAQRIAAMRAAGG